MSNPQQAAYHLKQAAISQLILDRISAGESAEQAFDGLFGAGAYRKLASDLWRALRVKQGLPV